MKLDVVDMAEPIVANAVLGFLPKYSDHIFYLYGQSDGFIRMCQDVSSFASASGVIDVLRIWGHGSNGNQTISGGIKRSDSTDNEAGLFWITDDGEVIDNVQYNSAFLQQLGELFKPDGHLELKGCDVASGADGRSLVKAIAHALGRPVQASMVIQTVNTVSFNGVGWTGNVFEAQPSGPERIFVGNPL